jgi:hypothetical protein
MISNRPESRINNQVSPSRPSNSFNNNNLNDDNTTVREDDDNTTVQDDDEDNNDTMPALQHIDFATTNAQSHISDSRQSNKDSFATKIMEQAMSLPDRLSGHKRSLRSSSSH